DRNAARAIRVSPEALELKASRRLPLREERKIALNGRLAGVRELPCRVELHATPPREGALRRSPRQTRFSAPARCLSPVRSLAAVRSTRKHRRDQESMSSATSEAKPTPAQAESGFPTARNRATLHPSPL